MTKDEAFKTWWHNEGSQSPHRHHDCEEHTMRMCEIAWANGAYKGREALAQPGQEPVAWANRVIGGRKWLSIHASKGASDKWLEYRIKEQAQGEEYEQIALYTTPPQRKPLTYDEIEDEWERITGHSIFGGDRSLGRAMYISPDEVTEFARAIEAAHGIKEKNT